jgi:hypothetical protein
MKTTQELLAELLQASQEYHQEYQKVSQEYQTNLTTLLEHLEWLEPYLLVGKKKHRFKSEVVGDADASSHEGSLTKPQDDFLEVHAPIHVENVCNGVDKTSTFNTPLEISDEADNTRAYDGHVDCTYDNYDDYDGLCVELSWAHSSSSTTKIQSSMAAITQEDVSGTHDSREGTLVLVRNKEHSICKGLKRGMTQNFFIRHIVCITGIMSHLFWRARLKYP